jgi:hypothetical protein
VNVRHTSIPPEAIECPPYTPDPGDRIRILVEYGQAWRPIFWFQLARDGSVYLGPRYTEITELRQGNAVPLEDSQFRVSYADGAAITDPEVRKKAKLSLHASGVINTPAGRFARSSLRSLSDQQLLCLALFQHPSAFAIIDMAAVKNRDVCLRYPIDEARPLWCHLYVSPKEKTRVVTPTSTVFQLNPLFEYSGLEGVPDLVLQLVLGHGPEGPWPPHSYMMFSAFSSTEGDTGCLTNASS